ncbi:MAG: TIGR04219 family outer membrane beta-barrel protein [Nitrospirae bacterium]|nr:TIGR04219 family outer membrane beta-barrel protein [Nitrospirota bacterium]MBF0534340.1 TIGR04219 family outer membrane beta-barrel protein [Nitrospirota bacterium]MBF0615679.1 TIGR04219 family outer membrane beta-barrel protein [Nitrospirota bacterium]
MVLKTVKTMALLTAVLLMFVSIHLPAAFADDLTGFGVEATLGVIIEDPGGHVSYMGTSLDVNNDLKYDTQTRLFGRFKLTTPGSYVPNFYLMMTPIRFSADGYKTVSFSYGGKTFTGGIPFNSNLQTDQYDIALYWGIPYLKVATNNVLNVDLGIDVKITADKAEISQGALSASKTLTIPVPMLYAGVQVKPVQQLSFEGEVRAITAGSTGSLVDLSIAARYSPVRPLLLGVGYRYEYLKVNISDVDSATSFSGPFFEAGVKF